MIQYDSQINGLGSTIGWISFLLHANTPVTIHISPDQLGQLEVVDRLKQLFDIPDSKILLEIDNNLTDRDQLSRPSDTSKLFAPYIEFNNIPTWKKPCIGVACSNNSEDIFTNDQFGNINPKVFPYNKYYTIEDNAKIFELIKRAGYDVITFDNRDFSIEQKIATMINLCDAVIGYEGGLCHIAHALKIPTIILPWQCSTDGMKAADHWQLLIIQLLHLDKNTFFLNNISEILNWSPDDLISKIHELKEGHGNNSFLNPNCCVKMSSDLSTLYFNNFEFPNLLSSHEKDFVGKYYDSLKLGGIKEIEFI
jgi:hypothetical protein